MANVFSTATLGLRVDVNQFNKNMSGAARTATHALESMRLSADAFNDKWRDLTDGIKDTKRIISGILISQGFYTLMNGLSMGAAAALEFSMNMETAAVSMEYFVDGTDKAAKSLAFLREMNAFAAETPFSTEDALSMSKYMQAVGISMNSTKSVLQVITDAAAATGATQENLQRIVFALGQMQTKGRIANEEIRQLANANIPIYEILQEELNLTGEEISNIGNYWIDADKAIVAILRGLEKRYDGASERISNTVSGMTDTIVDDLKIIAQHAGSGAYSALAGNLTGIRDALDRYREIAAEQGSMGLFNQILIDLDATGQAGERILALIGNVRQLSSQLYGLYLNAQPLIDVFGTGLYASISAAGMTLSSFISIANNAIQVLNDLGITTGTTGQVLASLYVAYKVSTWLGALGQAAAAAGYRLYEMSTAAMAVLPASLQAHKGLTLLTAGLAGLVTYGLTALGVFQMLNNAFAGLDTSKTGGNIFPDDYTEALKEYQQQMAEYNEAIKKYQADFNAPYTSVDDGVDKATSDLDKLEKENKKTANAVKNDWVASFDEVYSIPDQNKGGGGAGDDAGIKMPDFGSLLTLPEIKFPIIDQLLPEMPEFPWNDVYGGGLMESEVMNSDWWKSFLPFVAAGAALQIGKIMSKNHADAKAANAINVADVRKAVELGADDLRKVYKETLSKYDEAESLLRKTLTELRNPKNTDELQDVLSRNLDRLVDSTEKTVTKLDEVQDALKLTGSARRDTSVFSLAQRQSELNRLTKNIDEIAALQQKLADNAVATSSAGEAIRKEISALRDDTVRRYIKYAGKYGSDAMLEDMARTVNITMPSLSSSLEDLGKNLSKLVDMSADGFKNVDAASSLLADTKKLLGTISDQYDALGITAETVSKMRGQLDIISKAVTARKTSAVNEEMLGALRAALDNKEAFKDATGALGLELTRLDEIASDMRKVAGESDITAGALSKAVQLFDEMRATSVTSAQTQINLNAAFKKNWDRLLSGYMPETLGAIQRMETLGGAGLLRQFTDGTTLLKNISSKLDVAITEAANNAQILPILRALKVDFEAVTKGTSTGIGLSAKYMPQLLAAVQQAATEAGVDAAVTAASLSKLTEAVNRGFKSVNTKSIENYLTALRNPAPPRVARDTFSVKLADASIDIAESAKTIEEAIDRLYDAADKLVTETAIAQGISKGEATARYNDIVSEAVSALRKDFYDINFRRETPVRGISQEAFKEEMRNIGIELRTLPDSQADVLLKGIRSTAYDALDALEASRSAEWAGFVRTLKEGGVFDVRKALATGGDMGALYTGQVSFGATPLRVLIQNLLADTPLAAALRTPPGSATNAISRFAGNEAEMPALRILAEYLEENNKALYKTASYIDESRKTLVQLDGAIGDLAGAQYPVDTKVLSSSSYNRIMSVLEQVADIDGKTIKVSAEGFQKFLEVEPSYALQIAAQAKVLGTNTASLAIFDQQVSGLLKTLGDVSDINIATRTGENVLKSRIREAIVDALSDSTTKKTFADTLRLIEFEIPESAKKTVDDLSDFLRWSEITISEMARDMKLSNEDLIKLFDIRLASGESIGAEGLFRYIGKNFTWGNNAPGAINQLIRALDPLLKSGRAEYIAEGVRRLSAIQGTLQATLDTAKQGTKLTDELVVRLQTNKMGGAIQEVRMTGEEILSTIRNIDEYQKAISGYQYALVTQTNDYLRQLAEAKALGKGLTDVAYTTVKNGEVIEHTVEEILRKAISSSKQLEKIYTAVDKKLSSQLASMLEMGRLTDVENPFRVANIYELTEILEEFRDGTKALNSASDELPKVVKEALSTATVNVQDEIADTVSMLEAGAKAQLDAADDIKQALEQGKLAGSTSANEAAEAIREATAATKAATENAAEAAEHSADAAKAAREAAEAASAASTGTGSVKFGNYLSTDDLLKLLQEVKFDPSKTYTVLRNEGTGMGETVVKISGKRLSEMQELGSTGLIQATILDEYGKTIYEPAMQLSAAATDFAKLLNFVGSDDGMKLASLLGMDNFLKFSNNFMDELVAKILTDAGKTPTIAFSDAVGGLMDDFFASIDDVDFDSVTKLIGEAYSGIGDNFVKNLDLLLDGGLSPKLAKKVTQYLDDVIGDGLGITAEEVSRQLSKSTTLLGRGVTKKYADEISLAAEEALESASKQVADSLGTIAPELKLSDDLAEALSEAGSLGKVAGKGAGAVGKGLKASDIIFDGVAGIGVLDVLGIGLEGYLAAGDAAAINNIVTGSLQQDSELTEALAKLDAAGVSLGELAATGEGFFHSLKSWFGAGDLTNAAYSSVGVETGATALGGLATLGVGALSTAAWPAALAGAIVSAGTSLIYGLTGGDTVGNQYSDAYISALEHDTIYNNALKAGLTEEEARLVSDKELALYGDLILSDLDTGFWKGEDMKKFLYGQTDGYGQAASRLSGTSEYATQNRLMRLMQALGDKDVYMVEWSEGNSTPIDYGGRGAATTARGETWQQMYKDSQDLGLEDVLYQTGNLEGMVQVLDYIFKRGNYDSDVAKEFFKNYGEEELAYLRTTEYGDYMEAYENAEEFVSMLNELGVLSTDLQAFIDEGQLAGVIQAAVNFKNDANASMSAMLDVFKQFSAPVDGVDGAYVQKQASWISSDDDMSDDQAGQAMLNVFNGMSKEVTDMLLEEYGIAINAQVKEFENSSGQMVSELYTAVQLDTAKLQDDIVGWTVDLPDNISLDGASLSANDIEVLAQAGIQINSDGTVSFMKALNENITGTEREASLTADDLSKYVLDTLAGSGISINAGEKSAGVDLDSAALAGNMTSAMFRSTLSSGEVSQAMLDALSGLGRVLDSGYIEITNKAVLNGEMTIAEYIDSMGAAADRLSPEVRDALLRIDAVIAQGGEASAQAAAEWADGIKMKSPIDADELTPEIQAAFKEIGISFAYEGDQLMMGINRLGDNLKDGMTLIPEETWDTLNESVKMGLRALGVTWTTEAGMVKVDISNTLGSLVSANDITPSITAAFDQLGYTFSYNGDRIVGILDEKGNLVKNSLLKIPEEIYNTIDPAVITALEDLGADISLTGDQAMIDLSALISTGVGDVVATFVEQPELWNQIPEQVKATLEQAGIVTEEGLLKINSKTISGLQPIGEKWVGFWENMPEDTREAMEQAGINTDQGLFTIEKYIDETSIPDGVDAIIKKFDELPPEMQEAILAAGDAINENGYVIYDATADAVLSMEEAIIANKDGAITAAQTMAEEIGKAVSEAIRSAAQLENLQTRAKSIANSGLFHWGETTDTGTSATYNKEGYTVFKTYSSSGSHNGYVVFKNSTGESKRLSKDEYEKFNGFATGGTTTEGLTLAGERGRELAVLPNGKIVMLGANGRGELADLPEGTRVLNNEDTEAVLKYAGPVTGIRKLAEGNTTIKETGLLDTRVGTVASAPEGEETVDFSSQTIGNIDAIVSSYMTAHKEAMEVAIRGAVGALSEIQTSESNELTQVLSEGFSSIVGAVDSNISKLSGSLTAAIDAAADSVQNAVSTIRVNVNKGSNIATGGSTGTGTGNKPSSNSGSNSGSNIGSTVGSLIGPVIGSIPGLIGSIAGGTIGSVIGNLVRNKSRVAGSAKGSLVTKDALYRAGELGLNEAIIPLEQPDVLDKVGSAIGGYVTTGAAVTKEDIDAATQLLIEAWAVAVRGAVAAITENQVNYTNELGGKIEGIIDVVDENLGKLEALETLAAAVDTLSSYIQQINSEVPQNTETLAAAVDTLSSYIQQINSEVQQNTETTATGFDELPVGLTAEFGQWFVDSLAAAREAYGSATTDADRAAAHQIAEDVRSLLGYSGGPDGSQYIPLSPSGDSDALTGIAEQLSTKLDANAASIIAQLVSIEKTGSTFYDQLLKSDVETYNKWSATYAAAQSNLQSIVNAAAITVANEVGSYVNWSQNTISALQAEIASLRAALSSTSTRSTIKGSAKGSLVTKDALYRAGELGLNEAIIPLEQPDVLDKVGKAIGEEVPGTAVSIKELTARVTYTDDALSQLNGLLEANIVIHKEAMEVAIRGAVGALSEIQTDESNELTQALSEGFNGTSHDLTKAISEASSSITEAISSQTSSLTSAIDSASDSVAAAISNIKLSAGSSLAGKEDGNTSGGSAGTSGTGTGTAGSNTGSVVGSLIGPVIGSIPGLIGGTIGAVIGGLISSSKNTARVRGSASGSLVTKDALYRAGELGLNEAIIPLERPDVLSKVGKAIGEEVPTAKQDNKHISTYVLFTDDSLKQLGGVLDTYTTVHKEAMEVAIRGAVGALLEYQTNDSTRIWELISESTNTIADELSSQTETISDTADSLSGDITNAANSTGSSITSAIGRLSSTLSSAISAAAADITAAVNSIEINTGFGPNINVSAGGIGIDDSSGDSAGTSGTGTAGPNTGSVVGGLIGPVIGSIPGLIGGTIGGIISGVVGGLTGKKNKKSKIKGSAGGSLVTEDALYRAGELGLNEAIIPLERPDVLRQVGSAIASFMPPEREQLVAVAGMRNAGVNVQPPAAPVQDPRFTADALAQRVLETVLPQIAFAAASNGDEENKRPLYVGTLIADEQGLKTLERRLYDIRQLEATRR